MECHARMGYVIPSLLLYLIFKIGELKFLKLFNSTVINADLVNDSDIACAVWFTYSITKFDKRANETISYLYIESKSILWETSVWINHNLDA